MERVFPMERRIVGALRPVAKRMTSLPLPDDNVYEAVRRFYDKLEGVRKVLTDPATTSVRLVMNPERMVIAEAQRTFTYLNLFGYRVDAVIANRLLPEEVTDPYFARWKKVQAEHLTTIEDSFSPVPILRSRLRDQELSSTADLLDLGAEIYDEMDAAAVLFTDDPLTIVRDGDGYVLTLKLPFTAREELELSVKNDELFVKVGPYRRTIMLPRTLASRTIDSAQMTDDRLRITFTKGAAT